MLEARLKTGEKGEKRLEKNTLSTSILNNCQFKERKGRLHEWVGFIVAEPIACIKRRWVHLQYVKGNDRNWAIVWELAACLCNGLIWEEILLPLQTIERDHVT